MVSLLDVVHVDAKLFMVFEYLDKDLKKHMDENRACGGLPSALVRSYMYQLLEGIAYCHAHQVMHRDLKPQNLLIDNQAGLFVAFLNRNDLLHFHKFSISNF